MKKALSEEVASAIIGSVVSFMSPSQGAGPFYSQLAMLVISTIAATVQTYYKVNYWRKEKARVDFTNEVCMNKTLNFILSYSGRK